MNSTRTGITTIISHSSNLCVNKILFTKLFIEKLGDKAAPGEWLFRTFTDTALWCFVVLIELLHFQYIIIINQMKK